MDWFSCGATLLCTGVCVRAAERSLSGSEKNKRGKYSSPKSKSDEAGMTTNTQDLREAEELRAQAVASVLSASESCRWIDDVHTYECVISIALPWVPRAHICIWKCLHSYEIPTIIGAS